MAKWHQNVRNASALMITRNETLGLPNTGPACALFRTKAAQWDLVQFYCGFLTTDCVLHVLHDNSSASSVWRHHFLTKNTFIHSTYELLVMTSIMVNKSCINALCLRMSFVITAYGPACLAVSLRPFNSPTRTVQTLLRRTSNRFLRQLDEQITLTMYPVEG